MRSFGDRVRSPGERVRVRAPLLGSRVGTGRGATEQPNVSGDADAALTPLFWAMVVLTGVGAGLFGAALMLLLSAVERAAFGSHGGDFESSVLFASDLRRVVSLTVAGVFGGVAWFLLRRYTRGQHSEVDDVLWSGAGNLSFRRSLGTSVISEIVIGMGASLGREAAPKLMGGATGSVLARWGGLSEGQQRLLVACGAGAGLAAVYNVPLGGALFAAEVLCGAVRLPIMLPLLACSLVGTATAWVYLPARPTYLDVPAYGFVGAQLGWALPAGALIGLVAVGFVRLVGWVSWHRPRGWFALVAPLAAFLVLAGIGLWYPQLFGNGKDIAHDAFLGRSAVALMAALFVLKPLVTALCLGSGASGGLFTPTLSTGAALGGLLGGGWSLLWPGAPLGSYALIGAAAMIGAAMQAPLAGLALVVELTHTGFALLVPMMAATVMATAVAWYVDGYSIYSARLSARARPTPEPDADRQGR